MTQNRFVLQKRNLVPGRLENAKGCSSSCDMQSLAVDAVTVPDDLSEREMAEVVEHAKTCSTCGTTLTQYQGLVKTLLTFPDQKMRSNEPGIQMPPKLQYALAQHELKEKRRMRQRSWLLYRVADMREDIRFHLVLAWLITVVNVVKFVLTKALVMEMQPLAHLRISRKENKTHIEHRNK